MAAAHSIICVIYRTESSIGDKNEQILFSGELRIDFKTRTHGHLVRVENIRMIHLPKNQADGLSGNNVDSIFVTHLLCFT